MCAFVNCLIVGLLQNISEENLYFRKKVSLNFGGTPSLRQLESISEENLDFRKMFVVCVSSKYGFCKFGKKCDNTNFSDICEITKCTGN